MQQRILIAAHETDFLELLASGLNTGGYNVLPVVTGLATLKEARAFLPDLIVLDSPLPDIDAPAVCDILRRLPSTATIPILMLTALSEQTARPMTAETGPDVYVSKPITSAGLVERVDETLSRWREIKLDREAIEHLIDHEPRIDWSEA